MQILPLHISTIKGTDIDDTYKYIFLEDELDNKYVDFINHKDFMTIVKDPAVADNNKMVKLKVELRHEGEILRAV